MKFAGVNSKDQAAALHGHFLAVPEDELVILEEDEFWHWELEGLEAFAPDGNRLGTLIEVIEAPAHDLYLIRTDDGREHLVPAVHEYVPEIDIEKKRVVVIIPFIEED